MSKKAGLPRLSASTEMSEQTIEKRQHVKPHCVHCNQFVSHPHLSLPAGHQVRIFNRHIFFSKMHLIYVIPGI